MTYYDYEPEETILLPTETRIRIDCWLDDVDHLETPDRYGEYNFTFNCFTHNDHQRLAEHVSRCVSMVQLGAGPHSRKEPTPACENSKGQFKCSQLFKPKLNVDPQHYSELIGKQATLCLHLRDDPTGKIYLQAEFCDLYEEVTYPDAKQDVAAGEFDEDDW